MTREDFIDGVTTWDELNDFCCEYDCGYLDDVYDDVGIDDYLDRVIEDWARNLSWSQLRDKLNDIPTGGYWYRIDDYDDIIELDDIDFEAYKSDVLSWADDRCVWDEEDDEDEEYIEDEEENTEDDEDDEVVEESFSLLELYSSCHDDVTNALMEEEKREEESDNALVQLVGVDIAM